MLHYHLHIVTPLIHKELQQTQVPLETAMLRVQADVVAWSHVCRYHYAWLAILFGLIACDWKRVERSVPYRCVLHQLIEIHYATFHR